MDEKTASPNNKSNSSNKSTFTILQFKFSNLSRKRACSLGEVSKEKPSKIEEIDRIGKCSIVKLNTRLNLLNEISKEYDESEKNCLKDAKTKFDTLIEILAERRDNCMQLVKEKYGNLQKDIQNDIINVKNQIDNLEKISFESNSPKPIYVETQDWKSYSKHLDNLHKSFQNNISNYWLKIEDANNLVSSRPCVWRIRLKFEEDLTQKLYRFGKIKETCSLSYIPRSATISGKSEEIQVKPDNILSTKQITESACKFGEICYFNNKLYVINEIIKIVFILDFDGKFLNSISYSEFVSKDKCRETIAVSQDFVYIVSWRNNSILAFNHKSQLKERVSNFIDYGKLNAPFHPIIDSASNLLIADRMNKQVLKISPSLGSLLAHFREDQLDRICSMCINENDNIILAYHKIIKYYSINGDLLATHNIAHMFPSLYTEKHQTFLPNVMSILPFGFVLIGDGQWLFLYNQDEEIIYYMQLLCKQVTYLCAGKICTTQDNSLNFYDISNYI